MVSSSARVTSAKFHKSVVGRYIETPGPIDRTPETPGSGKKIIADFIFTKYKVENKENCEEIEDTECQLVPGQVGTDYQRRERDIHTI